MLKLSLLAGLALLFGAKFLPGVGSWLGLRSRKSFRQAKWMWSWVAGTEAESLQAERDYGRECAREFAAGFSGRAPRASQELVASVGSRLAAAVNDPRREFQFTVVVAAAPNAFALPGGFVFITQALVDLCEGDQGELAFFLGHEMAHVLGGHAKDRLTADAFLSAVTRHVAGAGLMLRRVLAKGYSRDLELDADREGARLAAGAGFDPRAAARGLRRLAQASTGHAQAPEYFSSHPPLAERVQRLTPASS